MKEIYFENIHRASEKYPYLDFSMQNIHYVAHFHEEIELIYVLSGAVHVVTEQEEYTTTEGSICIFMPGEIHSFSSPTENRLYIYKLMPPAQAAQDFSLFRLVHGSLQPGQPHYQEIKSLIFRIKEEEDGKRPGYEFAVNRDVNQILLLLRRYLPFSPLPTENRRRMSKKLQLLSAVHEYISENYMQDITLNGAAAYCGYSRYYFAHQFREAANISFMEFVTLYRLEKAARLMRMTEDSLTNIAFSCGFCSMRTFNRAFASHFSMSPSQYRSSSPL